MKRSLKIYKERRDYMALLLEQQLDAWLEFRKPAGGLAFWVTFRKPVRLLQLKEQCEQNNLFLPRTILYQSKDFTALRLGFGNLDEAEMEQCIGILKRSLEELEGNSALGNI